MRLYTQSSGRLRFRLPYSFLRGLLRGLFCGVWDPSSSLFDWRLLHSEQICSTSNAFGIAMVKAERNELPVSTGWYGVSLKPSRMKGATPWLFWLLAACKKEERLWETLSIIQILHYLVMTHHVISKNSNDVISKNSNDVLTVWSHIIE